MSIETERAAQAHPAYDDGLRNAVRRAAEGTETEVCWDGTAIYVRSVYAPMVAGATVVCIAQKWDEHTVQLRFAGARSEWVKI